MKRLTAIILTVLSVTLLSGCGNSGGQPAQTNAPAPASDAAPADSGSTAQASAVITDGSKCGVLQKVAEQDDFIINGLILTTGSGHHDYPAIEELSGKGYQTAGLYSEYMLGEWIAIYAACGKSMNIYVVPNQPDADYAAMTEADLQKINESAAYENAVTDVQPDPENYGHVWDTYVHQEMDAGLYNVCFVSGGKLCYLVQLNLIPEAAE